LNFILIQIATSTSYKSVLGSDLVNLLVALFLNLLAHDSCVHGQSDSYLPSGDNQEYLHITMHGKIYF